MSVTDDTVGKRIKDLRKHFRLTQKKFADVIGISQGNLSEMEKDKFYPSVETVISIIKYFHVSADWLLLGSGPGPDPLYTTETIDKALKRAEELLKELPDIWKYYCSLPPSRKYDIAEKHLLMQYLNTPEEIKIIETISDPDLKRMINVLKEIMGSDNPNLRGWAIVQFENAFRKHCEEYDNKEEDIEDS